MEESYTILPHLHFFMVTGEEEDKKGTGAPITLLTPLPPPWTRSFFLPAARNVYVRVLLTPSSLESSVFP